MDPSNGRTVWDVLYRLTESKKAAFVLLSMIFLLPTSIWYIVHLNAEPGTTVSLFGGAFQYNKAKKIAVAEKASAVAEVSSCVSVRTELIKIQGDLSACTANLEGFQQGPSIARIAFGDEFKSEAECKGHVRSYLARAFKDEPFIEGGDSLTVRTEGFVILVDCSVPQSPRLLVAGQSFDRASELIDHFKKVWDTK